jgi:hypothetical protein
MYKNSILNTAIKTTLALPRYTVWTATAVAAALSLDAGLAIVGDSLNVEKVGTPVAFAVAGDFVNSNCAGSAAVPCSAFITAGSIGATEFLPAAASATAGVFSSGTLGATTNVNRIHGDTGIIGIQYATEVLSSSSAVIPWGRTAGTDDYQVAQYIISGAINKKFTATFALTGASFSGPVHVIVYPGDGVCTAAKANTNPVTVTASGAQAIVTVPVASCSISDGTNIYLAYKLTSITAKNAGDAVTMTASFKEATGTGEIPNPTRTLTVVKATKGAEIGITPELGGEVYISASSGATEFTTKDPSTFQGNTAYVSDDEVIIGYVKITPNTAVYDVTGSTVFTIGNKNSDGTKADTAVLTISSGQFGASPGGVGAAGKVYIDVGSPIDALFPLADTETATWNLSDTNLKAIASLSATTYPYGAPIKIKANRADTINLVETDPTADMTVTLASLVTPSTETITGAVLRSFSLDGRVCWVYNVPSPGDNVADLLSIRITNGSTRQGVVTGTLYPQAGGDPDPNLTAVNLLEAIIADATDTRGEVLSLDGTEVALNAGATIRLSADDIAKIAGSTWEGTRKVLMIQSTIPELEVMTLLRHTKDATTQPLSNVSTGVTGSSCVP